MCDTPLCGGCRVSLHALSYGRYRCPSCQRVYGEAQGSETALAAERFTKLCSRLMQETPRTHPAPSERVAYDRYYALRHMPAPHMWLNGYLRTGVAALPFTVPAIEAARVALLITRQLMKRPEHRQPHGPTWYSGAYRLRHVPAEEIAALWQAGMDEEGEAA